MKPIAQTIDGGKNFDTKEELIDFVLGELIFNTSLILTYRTRGLFLHTASKEVKIDSCGYTINHPTSQFSFTPFPRGPKYQIFISGIPADIKLDNAFFSSIVVVDESGQGIKCHFTNCVVMSKFLQSSYKVGYSGLRYNLELKAENMVLSLLSFSR